MRNLTISTALIASMLYLSAESCAQPPRYRPQRPTVSPYLNLLRNDDAGVPNYYSLVRPQLDQLSYHRSVTKFAQSTDLAIRDLTSIAGKTETGPTGTGGVYNNLSHFYPAKRAATRRR